MEYNHIKVILFCSVYLPKSPRLYLSGNKRERLIQIPLHLSFVRSLTSHIVRRDTVHPRPPSLLTLIANSGDSPKPLLVMLICSDHRTHSKHYICCINYIIQFLTGKEYRLRLSKGRSWWVWYEKRNLSSFSLCSQNMALPCYQHVTMYTGYCTLGRLIFFFFFFFFNFVVYVFPYAGVSFTTGMGEKSHRGLWSSWARDQIPAAAVTKATAAATPGQGSNLHPLPRCQWSHCTTVGTPGGYCEPQYSILGARLCRHDWLVELSFQVNWYDPEPHPKSPVWWFWCDLSPP